MPPQCRGQGHPQKERRGRQKTQTHSPNPGPSHLHITRPSDDIGRLLDEVIESVEVIDDLVGIGKGNPWVTRGLPQP